MHMYMCLQECVYHVSQWSDNVVVGVVMEVSSDNVSEPFYHLSIEVWLRVSAEPMDVVLLELISSWPRVAVPSLGSLAFSSTNWEVCR